MTYAFMLRKANLLIELLIELFITEDMCDKSMKIKCNIYYKYYI